MKNKDGKGRESQGEGESECTKATTEFDFNLARRIATASEGVIYRERERTYAEAAREVKMQTIICGQAQWETHTRRTSRSGDATKPEHESWTGEASSITNIATLHKEFECESDGQCYYAKGGERRTSWQVIGVRCISTYDKQIE